VALALDSLGDERGGLVYQGCPAGTHTTWIVAELEGEQEAWSLVPVLLRDTARVVPVERCKPLVDSNQTTKGVVP
jgi:hypothetical protein